MTLIELKQAEPGLTGFGHSNLIRLFGWWQHVHNNKGHFSPLDIASCYESLHIPKPKQFGGYFQNLSGRDLISSPQGWRLSAAARDTLDAKYGEVKQKLPIKNLLKELLAKLPDLAERKYLDEALICYESDALRAAVVMTWNLAYAHLCDYIVKNRLADFNARWQQDHPGDHRSRARLSRLMISRMRS